MTLMTFRILFFLSATLFASCTSSTDASRHEIFRRYMGQTVALRRPMLLIGHGGYYFGGSDNILSARHARFGLTEPGLYPAARVFAVLPAGHRVTIDAVREEICVDAELTAVYGRTLFPPTGKEVSFAYTRAPIRYSWAQPLPWEVRAASH